MRIGIDISQLAYEGTGVENYLRNLVEALVKIDGENEYVLFFSSMRKTIQNYRLAKQAKFKIREYKIPPSILDLLWNKFHIFPIEWFIGNVDIFISSDWTQPPSKAKKATILYDLIVYKHSQETDAKIVQVQQRRLNWVKKECDIVFCISEATKKDAIDILGIEEKKLKVIYPGV